MGKASRSTKRRSRRRSKRRQSSSQGATFRRALLRLKNLKGRHQSQAIGMANDTFIRQMCQGVKKLRYNKKVNRQSARRLQRHRANLRQLVSPRLSVHKKRKLLSQRGGILPALIPLLLSAVGPVAGGIVGAAANKLF